jgi:hypothetical protein
VVVYASEFLINRECDLQLMVWNPDGFRGAASGPDLGRPGVWPRRWVAAGASGSTCVLHVVYIGEEMLSRPASTSHDEHVPLAALHP